MPKNWSRDRAAEHIDRKIAQVDNVTVVDFTRDASLENIPVNQAYRMDAVHLYADILNLGDMLKVTEEEGETCHKRTLRFLNLHYRAVTRILSRCDARRVDFHDQRLHCVIFKPYNNDDDAERSRIEHGVAVGKLIIDVLAQTGDQDEHIPNAKVRIGIDSGLALAVNNGRAGGREPLFLGRPANIAAKLSGAATRAGVFLSNEARVAIGLDEVDDPKSVALTKGEIEACEEAAAVEITADEIVEQWSEDLANSPIGSFSFSRHTPPLRTLEISDLTPANSRRQEAVSIYADIDGFTAYVGDNIENDAHDVVKVLHVIRAELDRVVTCDFDGRRIRFIGDCVHGLLCEGTAQTTDEPSTVTTATLCAGALRSSFDLALEKLGEEGIDVDGLGLAIGFELGPMSVTRLGLKGDRVRCCVSRGVLAGEAAQCACDGTETKIGELAYAIGGGGVKNLFGDTRKAKNLDYVEAVEALADEGDKLAKESRNAAYSPEAPAIIENADVPLIPYTQSS